MEESRVDLPGRIGWSCDRLESSDGEISRRPILTLSPS